MFLCKWNPCPEGVVGLFWSPLTQHCQDKALNGFLQHLDPCNTCLRCCQVLKTWENHEFSLWGISAGPGEGAVISERQQGALGWFHQLEQELEETGGRGVCLATAPAAAQEKADGHRTTGDAQGRLENAWKMREDPASSCPAIIKCSKQQEHRSLSRCSSWTKEP